MRLSAATRRRSATAGRAKPVIERRLDLTVSRRGSIAFAVDRKRMLGWRLHSDPTARRP